MYPVSSWSVWMPLPLSCAPSVRPTEPGESSRSVLCSMPKTGICRVARWEEAALELQLQNTCWAFAKPLFRFVKWWMHWWKDEWFSACVWSRLSSARAIKTFLLIARWGCSCYLLCSVSSIAWSNTDLLTDKLLDSYLYSTWRLLPDLTMKLRYNWECKSHVGKIRMIWHWEPIMRTVIAGSSSEFLNVFFY